MKDRASILFLSALLLFAVSYTQFVHNIVTDRFSKEMVSEINNDAEEEAEKSSEEKTRLTDQDEDPFRMGEMMLSSSTLSAFEPKNENYSFGHLGYYPEIVSPPPQG